MSEMIERVARAITIIEGDDPDGHTGSLVNNYELWWEHRIPKARAAIEAMRDPTEPMKDALETKMVGVTGEILDGWDVMIEAALKETVSA